MKANSLKEGSCRRETDNILMFIVKLGTLIEKKIQRMNATFIVEGIRTVPNLEKVFIFK